MYSFNNLYFDPSIIKSQKHTLVIFLNVIFQGKTKQNNNKARNTCIYLRKKNETLKYQWLNENVTNDYNVWYRLSSGQQDFSVMLVAEL